MIKSIKMAAAGLLASTSVFAADLPKKTVPLPPIPDRVAVSEPSFYVGAFAGGSVKDVSNWDKEANFGVLAGWQPFSLARLEGVYERGWSKSDKDSDSLFANVIGQYRLGSVTPYVLVGTGYTWADRNEAIWNVGGGVRYGITRNIETDLRYRYISNYDMSGHKDIVTLGLNYRF